MDMDPSIIVKEEVIAMPFDVERPATSEPLDLSVNMNTDTVDYIIKEEVVAMPLDVERPASSDLLDSAVNAKNDAVDYIVKEEVIAMPFDVERPATSEPLDLAVNMNTDDVDCMKDKVPTDTSDAVNFMKKSVPADTSTMTSAQLKKTRVLPMVQVLIDVEDTGNQMDVKMETGQDNGADDQDPLQDVTLEETTAGGPLHSRNPSGFIARSVAHCVDCGLLFHRTASVKLHEPYCNKRLIKSSVKSPPTDTATVETNPERPENSPDKSVKVRPARLVDESSDAHPDGEERPQESPTSPAEPNARPHTSVVFLKCDRCPARYSSDRRLRLHLRTHNVQKFYDCPFCPAKFLLRREQKLHSKTHGKNPVDSSKNPDRLNGPGPYICNLCQAGFTTRGLLTVHERSHMDEISTVAESDPLNNSENQSSPEAPGFPCKSCDQCFTDVSFLQRHERRCKKHADKIFLSLRKEASSTAIMEIELS